MASRREKRRFVKQLGESEGFPPEALEKASKAYRNTSVYVAEESSSHHLEYPLEAMVGAAV